MITNRRTETYRAPRQKAVEVRLLDRDGVPLVATHDVKLAVGLRDNPYRWWAKRAPDLAQRRFLDPSRGAHGLIMVPVEDALGHLADSHARSLTAARRAFIAWLAETTGVAPKPVPPPVEVVWVEAILAGTADVWQRERRVGKYRVDLYCEKHALVVEIDECGHAGYSPEKEEAREKALRAAGVRRILRINPHGAKANVFAAVANLALVVGAADVPWEVENA
jgi:very-short-patch-repair endonuclease